MQMNLRYVFTPASNDTLVLASVSHPNPLDDKNRPPRALLCRLKKVAMSPPPDALYWPP